MKKLHGKIDWIIAEDDAAWQASQSATQSESAPSTQRRQKLAFATVTTALLLLLMGGWLWPRSTPAKGAIHKLSPVAAQAAAQEQSLTQTLNQTIESLGDPMHINNIQRIGDHVMAQVIVNYREEGDVRAYREARFYEKSAAGWQRIPPDSALLGPQKTLKIANFTILYRDADADAVYQAVPHLEQLYTTLRHDFGLPAVVPGVAYTIEVASSSGQSVNFYDYSQRKLTIPSPLLLSAPVEITPATLIAQATVYPLAHLLIHESIYRHDNRWHYNFSRWYPMENALSLWEVWQDGGPLADDRSAMIAWLYQRSKNASDRPPLPSDYAQLCRTYHIWKLIPSDLFIPLTCGAEDTTTASSSHYPALASTWPQQSDYLGLSEPSLQSSGADPITLETMIEYIVASYGRDKVPQLVAALGLGEQSSPDSLIPALFGVSRADFEAAWQAYLARHY